MRRILMVLVIAAVVGLMVPISPVGAADLQGGNTTVYFPYGNGATYSCAGGPPFVFDSSGTGNCSVEQIGGQAGLQCDIPTDLTFAHHGYRWVSEASLCR